MIDLELGKIWTTIDSENWLKSSKGSGVKIFQEASPNQEFEILFHIYFPTMECDYLRLVIQVQEWQVWKSRLTLKYCLNQVAKQEAILIQKFELDHKFKNLGHILDWVQFQKKMRTYQFINEIFKSMKLVSSICLS